MNKVKSNAIWICFGLWIFVILGMSTQQTHAASVITLVEEKTLYAEQAINSTVVAKLSANQTVEVILENNMEGTSWFKIKTWLGDCWIYGNESVMHGSFSEVDMSVSTLKTETFFDAPTPYPYSIYSLGNGQLAAQPIQVTGLNEFCYLLSNGTQMCEPGWYRIKTWLGEKWLYKPKLKELIKEEKVDLTLTLTDEELLYEQPYQENVTTMLQPQKIKVVSLWDTGEMAYRFRPVIWYKIETDQGTRWIYPRHPTLANVSNIDKSVELPTGAKGYEHPDFEGESSWVEPGTIKAFEEWLGWLHVRTSSGAIWVNPEWALKVRPIGTVSSEEFVKITADTASYKIPDSMTVAHDSGFYAPQEVQCIAKWIAPNGTDWYLIQGFDGDVWVKP